jgi:hypothetical protein
MPPAPENPAIPPRPLAQSGPPPATRATRHMLKVGSGDGEEAAMGVGCPALQASSARTSHSICLFLGITKGVRFRRGLSAC